MKYKNFYDKTDKEISRKEWHELLDDLSYKIIDQTNIGEYLVSTVLFGLDQNFAYLLDDTEQHIPHLFETMVINNRDKYVDMKRYSTIDEAIEGHKEMVEKYK